MRKHSNLLPLKILSIFALCVVIGSVFTGCGGGSSGLTTVTSSGTGGGGGGIGGNIPDAIIGGADTPNPVPPPVTPPGGGGGGGGGGGAPGSGGGGSGGSGGSSVSVNPGGPGGIALTSVSSQPGPNGLHRLEVSLLNASAFQIVAVGNSLGLGLATLQLESPDGNVLFDSEDDPIRTLGVFLGNGVNTVNYQIADTDEPVVDGTYAQTLFATSSGSAGSFTATVIAKNDTDFSRGTLRVNVFLVGEDAQAGNARAALDQAINRARSIYSRIGITLDIVFYDVTSDTGIVPVPFEPSTFYATNTSAPGVRSGALNLFVALDISADTTTIPGNPLGALGVSGGIPGPAIPSAVSAVAISLMEISGGDLAFSNEETRIMGIAVAHEALHYLGVFHPVEISGSSVLSEDALADTLSCETVAECISNGAADNLMFPFPVSGADQEAVTEDQAGVGHRNLLVS